jgi:hypothetical protein
MGVISPGRCVRGGLFLLGICLLTFSAAGPVGAAGAPLGAAAEQDTGTFEKLIVASGSATLDLDLQRLAGTGSAAAGTTWSAIRSSPSSLSTASCAGPCPARRASLR